MKRLLFLLCFLFQVLSIGAQTLSGTVVNQATGEAIPGVAVYLDGTSTYTVTDAQGRFTLTTRGFINTNLVFSLLGYTTLSIRNPFSDLPERIGMEVRPYEIEAVTVQPAPFPRPVLLRLFRESFLGTTLAGRSCTIENEDDIGFTLDRNNKILRAHSAVPLRVRNPYLGYDIVFDLSEFSMQLGSIDPLSTRNNIAQFTGTSIYTDRREGNERFARRRGYAYESSIGAFFSDLAWKQLEESDFVLFRDKDSNRRIGMKDLPVTITDSVPVKRLTIDSTPATVELYGDLAVETWLGLELGNTRYPDGGTSIIYFLDDQFLVDRFGNLDNPAGVLKWGGALSRQGLGDMLPLDFETPR